MTRSRSIAKKFHVTTRAIADANPGVDPTKLQIDQVLHIPAPISAVTNGGATGLGTSPAAGNGQVYTVKSGDTLIGIAGRFGVTLKALRAANSLSTDRIRVGQKLNIPAKAPASTSGSPLLRACLRPGRRPWGNRQGIG